MREDTAPTADAPRRRRARPAGGEEGASRAADARPAGARIRRALLATAGAVGLGALLSAPWWARPALGHFRFFAIRRVEVEGARYASVSELVRRLGVDTAQSVWSDLGPLRARLVAHPLVARVELSRRLPGTLVVRVVERVPVGMAPARGARLAVYDAEGHALPIEPHAAGGLDVPLLAARDTALLRLLGALRADAPRLYARVSEARRVAVPGVQRAGVPVGNAAASEFVLTLVPAGDAAAVAPAASAPPAPVVVRLASDVTVARLADVLPVEDELARRRVRVAELDLRFRDQVIARLP